MPELSKIEKSVYIAICELTNASPDGELTYTKILACYLSGAQNSKIPWSAIQKSKVYGKFPKATHITVMMACNKLVDLDYLTKFKIDGNFKYFVTSKHIDSDVHTKTFLEKISKYKRYLVEQFALCLTDFCPSLKGIEHDNYYGFMNKNPIYFNEYNWIWLTDDPNGLNSLKVFIRYRPNCKSIASTPILSQSSFNSVINEIMDLLNDEKAKYKLKFNKNAKYPVLQVPVSTVKKNPRVSETDLDTSFIDDEKNLICLNDGTEDAINASLSVSESSPFKYGGDTLFAPREVQKAVHGKNNFEFSFLKWKVVAWTKLVDDPSFLQTVLLVSKKSKNMWVFISIPKRKVICLTNKKFVLKSNGKLYTTEDLLKLAFKE